MKPSEVASVADIFPPAGEENIARPVAFARADAPPMLLLHGAEDGVVAARHSRSLATEQTVRGARAEARIYPDVGHAGLVLAFATPFGGLAPVAEDTARFITSA